MSQATKTHCKRGHEMTPENTRVQTIIQNGKPSVLHACKICKRASDKAFAERKRERAEKVRKDYIMWA